MSNFIDNNNNSSNSIDNNIDNSIDNTNSDNEKEPVGLLSFSIDILALILKGFLTIKELGKVDSAFCNKIKRVILLSILADNQSIIYDRIYIDAFKTSTDNFLKWIGDRKINILSIDKEDSFGSFSYLSNDGLLGLSRHCSHLQSLDISWCSNVTDTSTIEVARHCSHLQSLDISYCYNITDTSMIEVGRHCSHLQSLTIYGCKNITNTSLKQFDIKVKIER